MTEPISDLSSQSEIVIKQLMIHRKINRQTAVDTWYNSKTKQELERQKLFYVSGMRCYWELELELAHDNKWMNDPFDL